MTAMVKEYLQDTEISPLMKHLNLKAIEFMVKEALADKGFRRAVKEDFLNVTSGSLSKTEVLGVEIKTASQEKKNTLAKFYTYSSAVTSLEKEIELLQQELKLKQDNLKGTKLLEINNGTAQELATLFEDKPVVDVLDGFNLTVTFKQS